MAGAEGRGGVVFHSICRYTWRGVPVALLGARALQLLSLPSPPLLLLLLFSLLPPPMLLLLISLRPLNSSRV